MLTIISLFILAVVGIIAGWLIDKHSYGSNWSGVFYFTGGTAIIALIITLCCLININHRFDATVYRYETTVKMVDSYTGQDYGNMGALVEQVVRMNNIIVEHKAYYNSIWVGPWYSERIANLEPIKFGEVKNKPALE